MAVYPYRVLRALYLLWIGSHLARSRPQALALNETHQRFPSLRKQILLGLGSALLNPKNALFYLALMTALLGPDVTLLQQSTCGVWMVMVVLVWDLALVSLMGLPAVQQRLSRSLWLIERAAGAVLIGFGVWVLWRFCTFPVSLSLTHGKIAELKRAKLLALSLLLIAVAAFITTLFLPQTFWVRGVKAIAEAAMVGALADWFAVVALFRRVPIPFISRHTAIIPRNKDRIGDNLGQFVQEKFLDTQSLVALIRRYEPAQMIGTGSVSPTMPSVSGSI